jgi:polyisoprenoid-binding protein YceI
MKKSIFLMLVGFILLTGFEAKSQVSFKIKNAGFTVSGGFDKFTTDIKYNEADPTKSTFAGIINAATINTDNKKRDEHLRQPEYFDAVKYPSVTFKSTSVKANGAGKLIVNGNLTIKNVSKPVVLNVAVKKVAGKNEFSTSLDINRRDFGVGEKSFILADKLTIALKIAS